MSIEAETGTTIEKAVVAIPDVTSQPLDNATAIQKPLAQLVAEIKQEHAAVLHAYRKGMDHARLVGDLLFEAKERVVHCEWEAWVESNCEFGMRTAQAYMQVSKNWTALTANPQHAADLSIRQALALIKKPKELPDPTPTVAPQLPTPSQPTVGPKGSSDSQPIDSTVGKPLDKKQDAETQMPVAEKTIGPDGSGAKWEDKKPRDLSHDVVGLIPMIEAVLGDVDSSSDSSECWTTEEKKELAGSLEEFAERAYEAAKHLRDDDEDEELTDDDLK